MRSGDIRGRLLSPFYVSRPQGEGSLLDEGRLVEALILFDQVVVQSYRLLELPSLVATFGPSGLCTLIKTGALRLQVVPHVLVENNPTDSPTIFRFLYLTVDDPAKHFEKLLAESFSKLKGISSANMIMLEEHLRESHVDVPNEIGTSALLTLYATLTEERPMLRTAMETFGGQPLPRGARFGATKIERATYNIDPPWTRHLPTDERRSLTQQTLLAVGDLAIRSEKMRLHHALSGFRPNHLQMFEAHLRFLEDQLDPGHQATAFRKVLVASGVPAIAERMASRFIDTDALIRLRAARETKEFRAWLWTIHDASDAEIRSHVDGFAASAARLLATKPGKAIRWLASTAIGLIPGGGSVAGAAFGAADTFLLDQVFPQRGVVTFLDGMFPSLFAREPSP